MCAHIAVGRNDAAEREMRCHYHWNQFSLGCLAVYELHKAELWVPRDDLVTVQSFNGIRKLLCSEDLNVVDEGSTEARREAKLQCSADAYLQLRSLSSGKGGTRSASACNAIKASSRRLRDFVTWQGIELSGLCNTERFLDLMDSAFKGALSNGDDEIKSQMVQSWSKEHASLDIQPLLDQGAWKNRKKRKKRKQSASKTKKDVAHSGKDITTISSAAPGLFWPPSMQMSGMAPFMYDPSFFPGCYMNDSHCNSQAYVPTADYFGMNSWGGDPQTDHSSGAEQINLISASDDQLSVPDTDVSFEYDQTCNRHPTVARDFPRSHTNYEPHEENDDHVSTPDTETSWMFYQDNRYHFGVGKYARSVPRNVSKKGSIPRGLESIPDEDVLEIEAEYAEENNPKFVCLQCKREDSTGWTDKWKQYWCNRCWEEFYEDKYRHDDNDAQITKNVQTMQVYDKAMPPIYLQEHEKFTTQVQVMNMCCLAAARVINNPSTCIVALQSTILVDSKRWPLYALSKRTSFGDTCRGEVAKRLGGFYLPQVNVHTDDFGEEIEPFCIPVVFGSYERPEKKVDSTVSFRDDIRDKIKDILRICHTHGHEEIIVASKFEGLPSREVASLFYESLLEIGDAVGAFRRVMFALPSDEVPATVYYGFQEEFKHQSSAPVRALWKEGKLLVPRDRADVCLEIEIKDVKLDDVRGKKAKLAKPLVSVCREHQHWTHLPCGRIVLAACPQLCLSASQNYAGADVHIWHKVDRNQHLQIWEMDEEGGIFLKSNPLMRLNICADSDSGMKLSMEDIVDTLWMWRCPPEEQQIQENQD